VSGYAAAGVPPVLPIRQNTICARIHIALERPSTKRWVLMLGLPRSDELSNAAEADLYEKYSLEASMFAVVQPH